MESGVRFHTTNFVREKSDLPSPFAMKLRKHLRTKRLENVRQIGTDRIVDFKFGSGESENHIILELYSGMHKYTYIYELL
jgi:predicted ribosome quality control (RQC) complex YloA/Tae2 family protein